MARTFVPNDSLHTGPGAIATWTFGTYAAVMRRNSTGWNSLFTLHSGAGTALSGLEIGDGAAAHALHYQSNGSAARSTFTVDNADGWVLLVAGKASGSAAPRMHKYVYATDTWTHQDGSASLSNSTGTTTTVRFGEWEAADYLNGDLAAAAAWLGRNLTDAEVEQLPHTLAAWHTLAPSALWIFDQSATGQNLVDETGGGANQTAISGTSVATSSAPISYGHDASEANGYSAGGTGYTQNVAGTSTPTGSLTKSIATTKAGTSTPTGAITRATSRSLTGSSTPAGAVTRLLARLLGGGSTPTGTAAKETSRLLTGEAAPAGTVSKTTERGLAGSATPAGSIVRAIARTLTGSATPSGLITRALSRLLGGGSTPTGSLTNDATPPPASIVLTAGPPTSPWSTSPPGHSWDTDPPTSGWTAYPPTGG